MEAKDIAVKDGHLLIKNGDFVVRESDQQHIQDIVLAHKGLFKNSPLTGVGISNYINSPMDALTAARVRKKIEMQLQFDGYTPISVTVESVENISINAQR